MCVCVCVDYFPTIICIKAFLLIDWINRTIHQSIYLSHRGMIYFVYDSIEDEETIEIFIDVHVSLVKENIITGDRIIWVHLIDKRKTHAGSVTAILTKRSVNS